MNDPNCVNLLREKIGRTEFGAIEILPATHPFVINKYIEWRSVLGESQDVFLHVSDRGHASLQVGDLKYDGNTLFYRGRVDGGRRVVSNGYIIRFEGIASDVVEKVRADLDSRRGTRTRSISCFHGACTELNRLGVRLEDGTPLLPSRIFEALLRGRFLTESGRSIPVSIYKLGSFSGERIRTILTDMEFNQGVAQGTLLVAILGISTVVVIRVLDPEP